MSCPGSTGGVGAGTAGSLGSLLGQAGAGGLFSSPGMESLMQQMSDNPTMMSQVEQVWGGEGRKEEIISCQRLKI